MTAMTMAEKVALVKTILNMTGTAEDERITAYLNAAAREILSWRYSYSVAEVSEVPVAYEITQVYAVVAGYSQAGAEDGGTHEDVNRQAADGAGAVFVQHPLLGKAPADHHQHQENQHFFQQNGHFNHKNSPV